MIKIFITIAAISICLNTIAQHNWTLNPESYSYSHQIMGKAYVGGGIVNGQNIEIGAFCGDECRGIATTEGGACTYNIFDLTVYSNQPQSEIITFVIRDTDLTEYNIINTVVFTSGEETGDFKYPFLWMDEWLYQSTDFFVFQVLESNEEAIIDLQQKSISLNLSPETNLTALTPLFFIAPGANVFIGETEQISQENIVDFTFPQTYSIYGIDGLYADWTVNVSNETTSVFSNPNKEVTIFPTISETGNFFLSVGTTSMFSIYRIDGKNIQSGIAEPGTTNLKISELGIFVIDIVDNNNTHKLFKLVVTK